MNSKSSNVFLILFFTINWLVATVFCYKPSSRQYQSSVLIGSKIYYFGGLSPSGSKRKNDALYFNVDTSEFTAVDDIPAYIHHSSPVVHPEDENTCLLIGGDYTSSETGYDYKSPNQTYKFDTKTSEWSIEETSNEPSVFSTHYLTRGVSDNNGFIYFFAHEYSSIHSFIKLDINAMSWSSFNNSGDPLKEFSERFLIRHMNDLLFFDINSSKWSTATAQGEDIDGRFDHTAVLTSDERLIIYGGSSSSGLANEGPNPTLAVLKIGSSSYEWSIPSSDDESHPPLTGHSATIYGEKMYIAFGIDPYTENAKDETILAFNANDFSRIAPKKSKLKLILGISLGLTAGLLIIGGIGGYYFCRKRKNRQNNEEIFIDDNDFIDDQDIGVYRNPLVTRNDVDNNNPGYNPRYNPGYSNNPNNPGYVNNPRYNSNSGNPGYVNNSPRYVNNPSYISDSGYAYNPGYASDH
ncbi:5715_t:CDS:2 [Diversispora eburnea]|uniref:5715_t:CDS:1 n=1 Tax=Diversispora eburnea TaxID=1213867 RepID=A0A9N9FRM5_9GLOM|nr:5715_t:CDS:2 [Diversispora eburnea]